MEIHISKTRTISSMQEEFQNYFPYLKIEFYTHSHSQGEGSPKKSTLNGNTTMGSVQKHESSEIMRIGELMKVSELESNFAKNFGLSVQVFRKSGQVWLQTTTTDDWTLAEQNKLAAEKYDVDQESMPDPMDRQELE